MRLASYLMTLTKPELDKLKEHINAGDDEIVIIDCLSKRKSLVQIADILNLSVPTVSRRIKQIDTKVRREVESSKWMKY